MKQHPLLFSTLMVQAILSRQKTQTRRIVTKHKSGPCGSALKKHLDWSVIYPNNPYGIKVPILEVLGYQKHETIHRVYPPYEPSDQIWVRETWVWEGDTGWQDMCPIGSFYYKADFEENEGPTKWKPSIFMPREACRIILEITDIRAERLHDITEEDAKLEGVGKFISPIIDPDFYHRYVFRELWIDINGEDNWNKNPFIWAIKFKRIEP